MTWFALATRAAAEGPRPTIQVGGAFHDLHDAAATHGFAAVAGDVTAIVRDWEARREGLFALARALEGTAGGIDAPTLAAPFEPRRIFAAASNFIEHAEEMQTKLAAKAESEPYIFLKTIESVVGPGDTVTVPPQVSRPDWEVELGVVLGRSGKNVPVDAAHDLIAGYTIVNDVSARDRTRRSDFPFSHDWFRGKSFDSFTPLGPVFVPRDCLGDPHAIRLGLKVNGEAMQDGNTSEMIFNIYEQIAYLSTILELRAGDLIASGTPAGVGMGRGVFLKDGDVMDAWVDGIGELRNPVSAPHLPRA
ncbi:fumarylacetoacetate hydrolase family protein [Sphingopyxis granuli]|uniref:fumarylacetoacetate hydrolase family protein n=1 Tax=Sphingopyxis granuli TaxID=267128 RepID=UPI001F5326B2|nr:fumarylacetoacetate hydrolase family protein [Sphingopyxis granuli]UNK79262.1 fumarylacetoacetate hydrolase family protein [Sphingopyxis granuli]